MVNFHERSAIHCVHTHDLANVLCVCPRLQPFLILVIRWATDTQYITIHKVSWTVKMVSTLQKLSWGFLHAVVVMTHSGILDHYRSFLDPFCFILLRLSTLLSNFALLCLYLNGCWYISEIYLPITVTGSYKWLIAIGAALNYINTFFRCSITTKHTESRTIGINPGVFRIAALVCHQSTLYWCVITIMMFKITNSEEIDRLFDHNQFPIV